MPKYDLWGHTDLDIEIPEDVFPDEEFRKGLDAFLENPTHDYFESTYKQKKLHYFSKLPPGGKVRAVVVYQHGIHAHSGWGCTVPSDGRCTDTGLRVKMMTAKGYAVYGHDQLGHGYSEGQRFYIPKGDWTINRDDLVAFAKLVASKHPPGTPLFLSGESYGGCLALNASHALWNDPDKPEGFRGCVVGCPALHGDLPVWPVRAFLRYIVQPMAPTWTPFFMPDPITPQRIWKDDEVRAIWTDGSREKGLSMAGKPFCLGTAVGLLRGLEESQALFSEIAFPFHINHGTEDHGVPISGSRELYEKCQTPAADKELNEIEGSYHAFLAEVGAEKHMQHEIDWMEKRIPA